MASFFTESSRSDLSKRFLASSVCLLASCTACRMSSGAASASMPRWHAAVLASCACVTRASVVWTSAAASFRSCSTRASSICRRRSASSRCFSSSAMRFWTCVMVCCISSLTRSRSAPIAWKFDAAALSRSAWRLFKLSGVALRSFLSTSRTLFAASSCFLSSSWRRLRASASLRACSRCSSSRCRRRRASSRCRRSSSSRRRFSSSRLSRRSRSRSRGSPRRGAPTLIRSFSSTLPSQGTFQLEVGGMAFSRPRFPAL
mmetsp:Transcript_45541/g.63296  ORF Transcript_45541/g.63296 Transcript_45541/m.63296 type:complete len:259 (+) Transcript_45541:358-1134(+)